VLHYGFTLGALALKPSGLCNSGVIQEEFPPNPAISRKNESAASWTSLIVICIVEITSWGLGLFNFISVSYIKSPKGVFNDFVSM
jgi:hypothetical protein